MVKKKHWYTDVYLWIGLLIAAACFLIYILQRSPELLPGFGGKESGGELLNIKWRKRSAVDRQASNTGIVKDGEAASSSALELNTGPLSTDPEVAKQLSMLEPGEGNWETEQFNETALSQLKKLAAALALPDSERESLLGQFLSDDFVSTPLTPANVDVTYRGTGLTVERGSRDSLSAVTGQAMDAAQFSSALKLMLGDGKPRLSFKIVRITAGENSIQTRLMVEGLTRKQKQSTQVNAIWLAGWRDDKLTSLKLESFERVALNSNEGPSIFADVTAAAFKDVASFSGQFLRDNAYWAQRLTILEGSNLIGHGGIVVGDINGDGLDDLYIPDGGGLPNRMYVQKPDGSLLDVSAKSGTDWLEYTPSALLLDLDNDGDQDLVAATVQMMLFMENDGKGNFKLAGARYGVPQARTMCAADYDLDGDVDIFVCNYALPNIARGFGTPGVVSSFPLPYNDANNGGPNMLLRNRGDFRFEEVTAEAGLNKNNTRYSLSAAWEDYDNDGDPDLYVANDFGRNNLYRNDGGKFTDVAPETGVEDIASGMSVDWGDFDRDGKSDIYISNMFSSAGGRVAFQRQFGESRKEGDISNFQRMARGNTLFKAGENGKFSDVSEEASVTMGRWAWTSQFGDLNNDGWLDLVVGNGFVTGRRTDDL